MIHDFCLDVRICGLSQHGDEMVNSDGGCEIVPLPDRFTVIITIIISSSASLCWHGSVLMAAVSQHERVLLHFCV